jgi:hypothetical protein
MLNILQCFQMYTSIIKREEQNLLEKFRLSKHSGLLWQHKDCKAIQLQEILSQINQIHKPTTIFVRLILQLSFYLSRNSRNTVTNTHVQNTQLLAWLPERLSAPQWRTWVLVLISTVQETKRDLLKLFFRCRQFQQKLGLLAVKEKFNTKDKN